MKLKKKNMLKTTLTALMISAIGTTTITAATGTIYSYKTTDRILSIKNGDSIQNDNNNDVSLLTLTQGMCVNPKNNTTFFIRVNTDNTAAGIFKFKEGSKKITAVKANCSYLGHGNDMAFKSDNAKTESGLYIATKYDSADIKADSKKSSVVCIKTDGSLGHRYDVRLTPNSDPIPIGGITYDPDSNLFIIRKNESRQYYIGYFSNTRESLENTHGSFVITGSFQINLTVDGTDYSNYVSQGICYRNNTLYVPRVKKNSNDKMSNTSAMLRYKIGKLSNFTNKTNSKTDSAEQTVALHRFGTNQNYKFEIESFDFYSDGRKIFATNEWDYDKTSSKTSCFYFVN